MPTSALPRGRQAKHRIAWEATYGVPVVTGFQEINVYTSDPTRTRALEADDILGAGFANTVDARPAAPNVEDAAWKASFPLDLNQIGFILAAAFGRVGAPTGGGPYTHVFTSGVTPLPSLTMERELVAAAQYDGGIGLVLKTLKLPFKPGKGYTQIDADFVGAQTLAPYGSTAAGTPTVAALANRVANYVGALSVGGVQVGAVIDASMTLTNDITLDRYVGSAEYVAAAILEGQDVAFDLTARYSTDALRAYGVVDPNYLPPLESLSLAWAPGGSPAYSLTVAAPNVRFEPVGAPITNGKTITQALKGRAEVGASVPMLTATLVSPRSVGY
jgi:tail tube protein